MIRKVTTYFKNLYARSTAFARGHFSLNYILGDFQKILGRLEKFELRMSDDIQKHLDEAAAQKAQASTKATQASQAATIRANITNLVTPK